MKLYRAIENLIDDKKLIKDDTLFIAIDNIYPTTDGTVEAQRRLNAQLSHIRCLLRRKEIQYQISNYVCWEELLLSFHELLEFCSQADRAMDSPEVKQYLKWRDANRVETKQLDYMELFQSQIAHGKTIEECLSSLLQSITAYRQYKNFHVTKSELGTCWRMDCTEAARTLTKAEKSFCQHCYAVKQAGIPSPQQILHRLKYVYQNSMFKTELENLHLQLRLD